MKLLSVNVSLPKEVPYKGKTIRTGIFKKAVQGRVKLRMSWPSENLAPNS